ncbi:MAG TPA: DUF2064 domain-containing protein [Rhizomicrobium sp.]
MRFQRATLSRLLRRIGYDSRWLTWLGITPDGSGPWPRGFPILPQGPGDLGHRMACAARRLPPGPVVIVGSDIPDIAVSDIAAAFRLLGSKDAVFGPASDGGYWLVGLRRRPRFIDPFQNVRWSSEHALTDTIANLADKDVAILRELSDIDDGSAWHAHTARTSYQLHRRNSAHEPRRFPRPCS